MKNAHLNFDSHFFLRLDSADTQYHQPLTQELDQYFTPYGITFGEAWTKKRSRELSTRNHNFKATTINSDSLKTHPDCEERFAVNRHLSDTTKQLTPIPSTIKEPSHKYMIWNLYNNDALTACIYRILLEKDKGNTDTTDNDGADSQD